MAGDGLVWAGFGGRIRKLRYRGMSSAVDYHPVEGVAAALAAEKITLVKRI